MVTADFMAGYISGIIAATFFFTRPKWIPYVHRVTRHAKPAASRLLANWQLFVGAATGFAVSYFFGLFVLVVGVLVLLAISMIANRPKVTQ